MTICFEHVMQGGQTEDSSLELPCKRVSLQKSWVLAEQDERQFSMPEIKPTWDTTPDYTNLTWDYFPLV
jgi:hypothetical protein